METKKPKKTRGRPKKLDRSLVIELAMRSYWENGPFGVSLNEICELSQVSKPSMYREFGDSDGLMEEAIGLYDQIVLVPQRKLFFDLSKPAKEVLADLAKYATIKGEDIPLGCFYVKAKESKRYLEDKTQKRLTKIKSNTLKSYETWLEEKIEKGEVDQSITPKFGAIYIDSQMANALSLIANGMKHKDAEKILERALSALII